MQDYEVVCSLLEEAGLTVASVKATNQPDQFVVDLATLPGSWAALERALLHADFALIGWHNGTGYRCLVRDMAYAVEKRLQSA